MNYYLNRAFRFHLLALNFKDYKSLLFNTLEKTSPFSCDTQICASGYLLPLDRDNLVEKMTVGNETNCISHTSNRNHAIGHRPTVYLRSSSTRLGANSASKICIIVKHPHQWSPQFQICYEVIKCIISSKVTRN